MKDWEPKLKEISTDYKKLVGFINLMQTIASKSTERRIEREIAEGKRCDVCGGKASYRLTRECEQCLQDRKSGQIGCPQK